MISVKARIVFDRRSGYWVVIFCDPEYKVYSFKLADSLFSIGYAELEDMPEFMQEAVERAIAEGRNLSVDAIFFDPEAEEAGVEVEVPSEFIVGEGDSIVRKRDNVPVVISWSDLEAGFLAGVFSDGDGNPIEPDHPESPLRKLGLI